ncbi:gamma-glutamylcyclotransferase 2-3 [Prunus avium]|uniref:glutathione-specific gamma-glutamylcyclotransferase n=1 Tax=Prunus avium TaxID=42229 RepID=A0A6P5RXV3_PRUAV|nr:gamma-glutamylcyclotransferase 2-3 [Prunus avium]
MAQALITRSLFIPTPLCSPIASALFTQRNRTKTKTHQLFSREEKTQLTVAHSCCGVSEELRKKFDWRSSKMVMWVFGYGSLIWKAGFNYDERLVGFIKGYRRVFYQGSTDHRGTPEYPGRTVTLEPAEGEVCWGVAYRISNKEDQEVALTYLEVREKQYDKKAYLDFFTEPNATTPAVSDVMVYIASPDKKHNVNYLGPASIEEIAKQIIQAEGPSGPNRDYLFQLEEALLQFGCKDAHVMDLASEVRRILSERELTST